MKNLKKLMTPLVVCLISNPIINSYTSELRIANGHCHKLHFNIGRWGISSATIATQYEAKWR